MYLRNLESFLTVARLLSFGEAARTLNYSQSTISEQIHLLEEYLGARLFERMGRRIFLTEQGNQLLPVAERLVRETKDLKNIFSDKQLVAGAITIGAAESLCVFWLPPLLKEFRASYPKVQINLKVGNCVDFPYWLQQNMIDVAFGLNDESEQQQLRQIELFRGETVFIVAPDHDLAGIPLLNIGHLTGQTVLLPEGFCGYPMDLKDLIEENRIKANTIMEFGSLESIKQCVKNGLGISLLPRISVQDELHRGELISLEWEGPDIPIQAQMLFHRDKWLSPSLAALEQLIISKTLQ
jgi:DNA-binding transcriptional LysR family regulator